MWTFVSGIVCFTLRRKHASKKQMPKLLSTRTNCISLLCLPVILSILDKAQYCSGDRQTCTLEVYRRHTPQSRCNPRPITACYVRATSLRMVLLHVGMADQLHSRLIFHPDWNFNLPSTWFNPSILLLREKLSGASTLAILDGVPSIRMLKT